MHSVQFGKPSLVCDFQEIYRHLIEDFLIQYCKDFKKKDFTTKTEDLSRKKRGKREYLNNNETKDFMRKLDKYFESKVEVPRIKGGKKQTLKALINKQALLLAQFLQDELKMYLNKGEICE